MANKSKRTFRQRFSMLSFGMILPLVLVISGLFVYSSGQLTQKVSDSTQLSATLYSKNFRNGLSEVESFVANLAVNDVNYAALTAPTDPLKAHIATHNIAKLYKTAIHSYHSVDALFVYSTVNDVHRDVFSANLSHETIRGVRSRLQTVVDEKENWYNRGWTVFHASGRNFLLYMVGQDGTYLAALVDLENSLVNDLAGTEMKAVFTDTAGLPYTNSRWIAENGITLDIKTDKAYHTGKPSQFLTVSTEVQNTPLRLFFFSPRVQAYQQAGAAELILLLLAALVLGNLVVLFITMRRTLLGPFEGLVHRVVATKEAQELLGQEVHYAIPEFEAVEYRFSSMKTEIEELKIGAYEKEIERQKADLQYLQLQIQPHFFLNCLKTLYGLAEVGKRKEMQELILAISSHLRYRFYDIHQPIRLADEISHVTNYLEIQKSGRIHPVTIHLNIEPSLNDILIPPFSIQTFTENSVKHGTMEDESLAIYIKARKLTMEEGEFLDITVTDNAGGFSEEVLTSLNYQKGMVYNPNHIGLTNLKKRMQYLYGGRAIVAFYNLDNGAVAELIIPYGEEEANANEHSIG